MENLVATKNMAVFSIVPETFKGMTYDNLVPYLFTTEDGKLIINTGSGAYDNEIKRVLENANSGPFVFDKYKSEGSYTWTLEYKGLRDAEIGEERLDLDNFDNTMSYEELEKYLKFNFDGHITLLNTTKTYSSAEITDILLKLGGGRHLFLPCYIHDKDGSSGHTLQFFGPNPDFKEPSEAEELPTISLEGLENITTPELEKYLYTTEDGQRLVRLDRQYTYSEIASKIKELNKGLHWFDNSLFVPESGGNELKYIGLNKNKFPTEFTKPEGYAYFVTADDYSTDLSSKDDAIESAKECLEDYDGGTLVIYEMVATYKPVARVEVNRSSKVEDLGWLFEASDTPTEPAASTPDTPEKQEEAQANGVASSMQGLAATAPYYSPLRW